MSARNLFQILSFLVIASLALAACGGAAQTATTAAPQVEPTAAEAAKPEAPASAGKFAIITSGPKVST